MSASYTETTTDLKKRKSPVSSSVFKHCINCSTKWAKQKDKLQEYLMSHLGLLIWKPATQIPANKHISVTQEKWNVINIWCCCHTVCLHSEVAAYILLLQQTPQTASTDPWFLTDLWEQSNITVVVTLYWCYICMCVCVCVCMCVYAWVGVHACMHACIYVNVCDCVSFCVCLILFSRPDFLKWV